MRDEQAQTGDLEAILGYRLLDIYSLGDVYPAYRDYLPVPDLHPLIYARETAFSDNSGDKVVIAFLGPSSSGKDSVLQLALPRLLPQASFMCTTTTRPRRSDEADLNGNSPMRFVNRAQFDHIAEESGFIELKPKGIDVYGTAISDFETATGESRVSLWRGGLDGLDELREWMRSNHPDIMLKTIVILPNITIGALRDRIYAKRGHEEWRVTRALEEIQETPYQADLIILNPIDPSGQPHDAADAFVSVLEYLSAQLSHEMNWNDQSLLLPA